MVCVRLSILSSLTDKFLEDTQENSLKEKKKEEDKNRNYMILPIVIVLYSRWFSMLVSDHQHIYTGKHQDESDR